MYIMSPEAAGLKVKTSTLSPSTPEASIWICPRRAKPSLFSGLALHFPQGGFLPPPRCRQLDLRLGHMSSAGNKMFVPAK